jgi:hypothetical protein
MHDIATGNDQYTLVTQGGQLPSDPKVPGGRLRGIDGELNYRHIGIGKSLDQY